MRRFHFTLQIWDHEILTAHEKILSILHCGVSRYCSLTVVSGFLKDGRVRGFQGSRQWLASHVRVRGFLWHSILDVTYNSRPAFHFHSTQICRHHSRNISCAILVILDWNLEGKWMKRQFTSGLWWSLHDYPLNIYSAKFQDWLVKRIDFVTGKKIALPPNSHFFFYC